MKLNGRLSELLLKNKWYRDYVLIIDDGVNRDVEIPLTFTQACAIVSVMMDIRAQHYTDCAACAEDAERYPDNR